MKLLQWLKKIYKREEPQEKLWDAYITHLEKNIGKPGTKISFKEFKEKFYK